MEHEVRLLFQGRGAAGRGRLRDRRDAGIPEFFGENSPTGKHMKLQASVLMGKGYPAYGSRGILNK